MNEQQQGWLVRIARRPGVELLLAIMLCLALTEVAYNRFYAGNIEAARQADGQRLDFYAISFENALEKYAYLPYLLSLERDLVELLQNPALPRLTDQVNRYLEVVQGRANVAAVYLLDVRGQTLAASNWHTPQSFVGQNYAFRPYFREPMQGRPGRFYGVGATTGEPGYFLSAPVFSGSSIIGVVVVKVNLEIFEQAWQRSGEGLAVSDEAGIIFISAVPAWKYRTLRPLSPEAKERLQETRQYASFDLVPLADGAAVNPDGPTQILRLAALKDAGQSAAQREFLVQSKTIRQVNWRVLLLTDLREAKKSASGMAAAVGFASAFLVLFLLYWQQRRRRQEERLAAQRALQRASEELEQRITERTAELVTANENLQQKIAALNQTEKILRETQDSAVQAGKLAVLGQMAAGITHELNQPLAALRTLSDNSVQLMSRSEHDEVRENLSLIGQLAERMGRIVGQLKTFARKAPAQVEQVSVSNAVAHALLLLEPRRRELGVSMEVQQPADSLCVKADAVRLEQVLVNLLRNAIDAMEDSPDRRLTLRVETREEGVRITIRDSGPGIAEEALRHLFEPFYTTKPVGKGLGLGLAISLAIIQSFGGELSARNATEGGAEFALTLPAA